MCVRASVYVRAHVLRVRVYVCDHEAESRRTVQYYKRSFTL